ncbi:tetratricopeptide repeat protein [Sphingomonas sp. Y38-1Y]|uniref:tetratricopeptide repeat protein n=1 Tax=Sphingomonas sp. Y38-1Y TaxID=3078265 RepID=UPI0028EB5477|nr:tetratricopeptide repeat protein [Sphingomonas sp. Y38-1Y]
MSSSDLAKARRLDGWKSIAAYFNRDRTTVMRWARERALPVRRLPGGKQGSVFAFEDELAAWALQQGDAEPDVVAPAPPTDPEPEVDAPAPPPAPPVRRMRGRTPIALAGAVVAVAVVAGVVLWRDPAPAALAMPRDPAVASTYVAARDAWARRTPEDLNHAIKLYQQVIARDPGFAPAHAGLAEAWLILHEYGSLDEPTAFRRARAAAEAALAIDPELPAANRAMGFIDYWWSGDADRALSRFQRAIDHDPRDWQTHFWLANVLAYMGRDAGAQQQYEMARLLSPGSRVIDVEQACSHWLAGRDTLAIAQLTTLAQAMPGDATIQTCLSWARIGQGDIAGYARAVRERARLRGDPQLLERSAALDAAVASDPARAIAVVIAQAREEIAAGARRQREAPAFFASSMGDRASLLALLTEAVDLGERWSTRPLTRRIAARWQGDAAIMALLRRVMVTDA